MDSFVAGFAAQSNIVEVVSSETDPESGAAKVVIRVLDEKPWIRMMTNMLKAVVGLDEFGLEVHKVFFVHEESGDIRFAWIIVHWGDPEGSGARAKLEPILTKRVAATPAFALGKKAAAATKAATPTAPLRPRAPAGTQAQELADPSEFDVVDDGVEIRLRSREGGRHRIKHERHVTTEDDEFDVFSIPLPHVNGPMFNSRKGDEVLTPATARGRFKATVRGRGEAEFAPKRGGGNL